MAEHKVTFGPEWSDDEGIDSGQPEGVPPLLRTSERSDWRRCPWLWDKSWNQGLRKRQSPVWAWFGTAIHAALEEYYPIGTRRGKLIKVLDAFHESVGDQTGRIYAETNGEVGEDFDTEIVDAKALGEAMLRGYIDHYEGDSEWEVIHTEQPFQINVPDASGETLVTYAGTWDSLMRHRFTKEFWLWDHKTRKTFPSEGRWGFYNINDQAGSYLWVAPEVLKHLGVFTGKEVIQGLVFNALKKSMPDDRPKNAKGEATNKPLKIHYVKAIQEFDGETLVGKYTLDDLKDMAERRMLTVLGEVSERQQGDLFHREEVYRSTNERIRQAQRVQAEALIMSKHRDGSLPLWKTPTEDCTRCPMFDMCELDELDPGAASEYARQLYRKTDPYRDHREDMQLKKGVTL